MTDITKIDDDETADNEGVDRLAAAMKAKLKAKRLQGRGGWHNDCPVFRLKKMFNEHLNKGDVLDLANFAMMIWNRENPTAVCARPEALRSEPTAWAIFASDTHEMIDLSLIEPDEAPGQYVEPLFAVSPLARSQEKT